MTSATATSAGIVVPATTSAWASTPSSVPITMVATMDLPDFPINPLDLRLNGHEGISTGCSRLFLEQLLL